MQLRITIKQITTSMLELTVLTVREDPSSPTWRFKDRIRKEKARRSLVWSLFPTQNRQCRQHLKLYFIVSRKDVSFSNFCPENLPDSMLTLPIMVLESSKLLQNDRFSHSSLAPQEPLWKHFVSEVILPID